MLRPSPTAEGKKPSGTSRACVSGASAGATSAAQAHGPHPHKGLAPPWLSTATTRSHSALPLPHVPSPHGPIHSPPVHSTRHSRRMADRSGNCGRVAPFRWHCDVQNYRYSGLYPISCQHNVGLTKNMVHPRHWTQGKVFVCSDIGECFPNLLARFMSIAVQRIHGLYDLLEILDAEMCLGPYGLGCLPIGVLLRYPTRACS